MSSLSNSSRYEDPTPVECEDCKWSGTVADCVHSYRGMSNTEGDVEPIEYCPNCLGMNLSYPDKELITIGE